MSLQSHVTSLEDEACAATPTPSSRGDDPFQVIPCSPSQTHEHSSTESEVEGATPSRLSRSSTVTFALSHPVVQFLSTLKLQGYARQMITDHGLHTVAALADVVQCKGGCHAILGDQAAKAHVEALRQGVQRWQREEARRLRGLDQLRTKCAKRGTKDGADRRDEAPVTPAVHTAGMPLVNNRAKDSGAPAHLSHILNAALRSLGQDGSPTAGSPTAVESEVQWPLTYDKHVHRTPSQFMRAFAFKGRCRGDLNTLTDSKPSRAALLALTANEEAHVRVTECQQANSQTEPVEVNEVRMPPVGEGCDDRAAPGRKSAEPCLREFTATPGSPAVSASLTPPVASGSTETDVVCSSSWSSALQSLQHSLIPVHTEAARDSAEAWLLEGQAPPVILAAQKGQRLDCWTTTPGVVQEGWADATAPLTPLPTTQVCVGAPATLPPANTAQVGSPCGDAMLPTLMHPLEVAPPSAKLVLEDPIGPEAETHSAAVCPQAVGAEEARSVNFLCEQRDVSMEMLMCKGDRTSPSLDELRLQLEDDLSALVSQYNVEVHRQRAQMRDSDSPFLHVPLQVFLAPAQDASPETVQFQAHPPPVTHAFPDTVDTVVGGTRSVSSSPSTPSLVNEAKPIPSVGSVSPSVVTDQRCRCIPAPACTPLEFFPPSSEVDGSQHTFIESQLHAVTPSSPPELRVASFVEPVGSVSGVPPPEAASAVEVEEDDWWREFGLDALDTAYTQNVFVPASSTRAADGPPSSVSPPPCPIETIDVDEWEPSIASSSEREENEAAGHRPTAAETFTADGSHGGEITHAEMAVAAFEKSAAVTPYEQLVSAYQTNHLSTWQLSSLRELCEALGVNLPLRTPTPTLGESGEAEDSDSDEEDGYPRVDASATTLSVEENVCNATSRPHRATYSQRMEREALLECLEKLAVRCLFYREVAPSALHRVTAISRHPYKRLRANDLVHPRDLLTRQDLEAARKRAKVEEQLERDRCIVAALTAEAVMLLEDRAMKGLPPHGSTPSQPLTPSPSRSLCGGEECQVAGDVSTMEKILLGEPVDPDHAATLVQRHYDHISYNRVQSLLTAHDVPLDTIRTVSAPQCANTELPVADSPQYLTPVRHPAEPTSSVSPAVGLSQEQRRRERTRQFFASRGFRTRGGFLCRGRQRGR